jgi:methionine synthase II (cobalamin-independent)
MPQLEQGTVLGGIGGTYGNYLLYQLRPGVAADDIRFPPLGYSAAAIASYAEFARLKREGIIPFHLRFEVCLPTPLAPIFMLIVPEDQSKVEAAYEARMLTELDEIVAAIPAEELAIQWDTAVEFAVLEGLISTHLTRVQDEILTRLVRLGNHVPADVELGFHLCYGEAGHRHFKEPEDMSKLVSIANGIAAGLARPLTWIHMPVPRNRTDETYYAPLKQLSLASATELYLGLVHLTDGVAGTQQRIKAAREVVPHIDFGVATECGLGPRPAETIPELLQIHAAVAAYVQ